MPITTPGIVSGEAGSVVFDMPSVDGAVSLARPKSRILMRSCDVTKMFDGFRSRWTMPFVVGGAQPVRDLRAEVERAAQRQPSPREQPVERRAVEELGHDVGEAALDADVEDRDDVGMVEGGRSPGLLLESAQAVDVVGHLGRQHLDRDLAIEALVVGAVDLAHAAGPEWRDDLVRAEARTWGQRHCVIILGSG